MAAFIVSNAALIEIKICEILHFVSKKEVFCNSGKWVKHYNIKKCQAIRIVGVFDFLIIFN